MHKTDSNLCEVYLASKPTDPHKLTICLPADLVAKTDKGRIVDRELWGDDDIFVAIDVYPVDSKKRVLYVPALSSSVSLL